MGKHIRAFFVLLLMCVALLGAPNYMQQLQQYDTQMNGASNDEMLRIFHGLKAIYIQSIIGSDDALKKETLERLIKTAKVLKLDASKYESELATLGKGSKKQLLLSPLFRRLQQKKILVHPLPVPVLLQRQHRLLLLLLCLHQASKKLNQHRKPRVVAVVLYHKQARLFPNRIMVKMYSTMSSRMKMKSCLILVQKWLRVK